jgi:hypothetical protein
MMHRYLVYRDAANILEQRGHTRFERQDVRGQICALGALGYAYASNPWCEVPYDILREVNAELHPLLGKAIHNEQSLKDGIASWNDWWITSSKRRLVKKFRKLAARHVNEYIRFLETRVIQLEKDKSALEKRLATAQEEVSFYKRWFSKTNPKADTRSLIEIDASLEALRSELLDIKV